MGQPHQDLVEDLERLLDDAKSGHLRGLAYATVMVDNSKGTGWVGADGTRDGIGLAVGLLQYRYMQSIYEDGE